MSIVLISEVLERAPYTGGHRLVLVVLADAANPDGICWPSVGTIARRAGLGFRQTHKIIADLKHDGVILVEPGGGRGKSSRYTLQLENMNLDSVNANSLNLETLNPATESMRSSSENSALCAIAIRKNRQEPSKNRRNVSPGTSGFNPTEIAVALCQKSGWSGKRMVEALEKAVQFQSKQMPVSSLEQVGEWLIAAYYRYKSEKGQYAVGPQKFYEQALYRDASEDRHKSGSLGLNPAEWAQSQLEVQ